MGAVLTIGSGGNTSKKRASRAKAAARETGEPQRGSLYDEVTAKIIAQLEAGVFPWAQPWSAAAAVECCGSRAGIALQRDFGPRLFWRQCADPVGRCH